MKSIKGMRLNEVVVRIQNFTTFIHSTGFGCFKGWKFFSDSKTLSIKSANYE